MPRTAKSKNPKPKSSLKTAPKSTRQIAKPTYKSFRLHKRIRHHKLPLKGAFRLLAASIKLLIHNWRIFGGLVLVYLLLTIVLVKGFGVGLGLQEVKTALEDVGQVVTTLTLFSILVSNTSSVATEIASVYQSMLLIIGSLAIIWALRQVTATKRTGFSIKDPFYKGMYPLIPFLLVLLVIGLQLIPLLLMSFLYNVAFVGGLAVTAPEQVLWAALLFCLALLSFYMITSSVFALYIVTLPNVTPMQALRSARELVRYRRWVIMRKVLFLPVALLVLTAIIMVPVIIISATVAEWLFLAVSMLTLPIAHSYMYSLYRELIEE